MYTIKMIFLTRYKKYCVSIKKSRIQLCQLLIATYHPIEKGRDEKKIYIPVSKLCIYEESTWYKLYIFVNQHTDLKEIEYAILCGISEMDSGYWFQPMVFNEVRYSDINIHYLVGYLQYKHYNIYITNKRWIIYYNDDIIVLNGYKEIKFIVSDKIQSNQYYQGALNNIFNNIDVFDIKQWIGDCIIDNYRSHNVEKAKYYQNGKWYKYELVEI